MRWVFPKLSYAIGLGLALWWLTAAPVHAEPSQPQVVDGLPGVKQVAAGNEFQCYVTTWGDAECWGLNVWGQLGDDSISIGRSTPAPVFGFNHNVSMVTAGEAHACVVTVAGGVKCWGHNPSGQLGSGTREDSSKPLDVLGLTSGIRAVGAGSSHTCALTNAGRVRCWGSNTYGQAGDGTTDEHLKPSSVSGLSSGVTALAVGADHACALTAAGAVKCWGNNQQGQLGDGTTINRLTPVDVSGLSQGVWAIAAGGNHTCAITNKGALKCWGQGAYGQLGDGGLADRTKPVDVTGLQSGVQVAALGVHYTCAVAAGGAALCWGLNQGTLGDGTTCQRATPQPVLGLDSGVQALGAGTQHTCAVKDGKLLCWGAGVSLPDSMTKYLQLTPAAVAGVEVGVAALALGDNTSCAATQAGGVQCWGLDPANAQSCSTSHPLDVGGLAGEIKTLAAGSNHTCALTNAGGVQCWGFNFNGQLGNGVSDAGGPAPVQVTGLSSGVKAIAAGRNHTCAVNQSGGVLCWGDNSYWQLGDEDFRDHLTPTLVAGLSDIATVATGETHTCALTVNGGVKCWGNNQFGQLGDGSTDKSAQPVDVSGLQSGVKAIAVGSFYTCALTTGGGVKCWGWNNLGLLGDGTNVDHATPGDVVGLEQGVIAIATADRHVCAITADGRVWCWGNNDQGALGSGTLQSSSTPVAVPGLSDAQGIAVGLEHTCVTTPAGVQCWGSNYSGQVGIGRGWEPEAVPGAVQTFLPQIRH